MWAAERAYDALIAPVAVENRPPGWSADAFAALIKAHIGQESSFNPRAINPADPSYGLGQFRLQTARDNGYLGNAGDPQALTGLFDPKTNIELMGRFIRRNLQYANGALEPAISAYNAGFGNPPNPLGRRTKSGAFLNQAYVDSVKENFRYFLGQAGAAAPLGAETATSSGVGTGPTALEAALLGGGILAVGVILWLVLHLGR